MNQSPDSSDETLPADKGESAAHHAMRQALGQQVHDYLSRLYDDGRLALDPFNSHDIDAFVRAAVLPVVEQYTATINDRSRVYHAALQRIGTRLQLLPGANVITACEAAIEALQVGAVTKHCYACKGCGRGYNPAPGQSEDCPHCGSDGTEPGTKGGA